MESKLNPKLNLTTPNQLEDILTRIQRARAFLHENPNEQAVTAACIYKLCPITL
jgi:hypothetical protein